MQRMMAGIAGAALAVCFTAGMVGAGDLAQVTGSAGYRERIALPPDAVLSVELLDVSKMDVAATVMSSQRFRMDAVPQTFALAYDPALIDERMSYSLAARIELDGKVLFRTTQVYPVLTRDAGPHADLMLVSAGSEPKPASAVQWSGRWGIVAIGEQDLSTGEMPVIDLNDPQRMGLKGACNTYVGATEATGGKLQFKSGMAGTMKACPPEIEQIDRDIITALEATDRYEVDGDQMRFLDANGVSVLFLRRVTE
ncbi:YbaY family lipoprotein [Shimia biformata]|uniref:YbaY family lipoprotein n=1 Tax=Shimia biformata TaxID=1294299 RepID=UPI0019529698|nr:YbaY family lipoprotein [Shimia biformata]